MTRLYSIAFLVALSFSATAQTSWTGTVSTAWSNASNWTSGVPNSSTDAIIGDASFTGSFQPNISGSSYCKSLTLGGTHAAILSMSRNLTVAGNVTINSNGTLTQGKTTITVAGSWSNSGTYTSTSTSSNIVFSGVTPTLGGTSSSAYRKLTVNAGTTLTLTANITANLSGSLVTVKGTLNPGTSPGFLVTTSALTINSGATLVVSAATFAANYTVSGTVNLNAASTVDYASTTTNQTVSSSFTYGTLRISGSGTKSLSANLPSLASSLTTSGNVYVAAGTLDLQGFTANRGTTTTGGTFTVLNGASLKVGGTNTFPANYNTTNLSLTSTVEYSGTSQTVAALTYGNLSLSSSSGAAVKTFPATAFTIAGNLTSNIASGTSVSYAAAAALSITGDLIIGASTTFDGGSFSHTVFGNWTNNGTFTGSTSTITLTGSGTQMTGTGTNNFNNLTITASKISAAATTTLNIAGSFTTSGPGTFTHSSGGTTNFTGTSKTITGTGITFDNLNITGTITTSSSLTLTGNFSVGSSGSFTASGGTTLLSGTSKTISGTGTKSFASLNITGSVSTAVNQTISGALTVSGSLTATAGTTTFAGTSSLNGTANLFNVTLNGTSLQLSSNAVLGIAGAYTITAGTLDVTTTTPNTVSFNGTTAQNVNGGTYHHLILSNGNTKTALAAITTNGNLTIAASTTFSAASFTHTVNGSWINNGTFTSGTSTVTFAGATASNITGATTFATLTLNKTSNLTLLNLLNNVNVATVNMTSGQLSTGSNTLTITTTRTGNGIILGNIQRTNAFSTGTAYAFESPQNTITFSSVSGVTSVTVSVTKGTVSGFPFGSAINRTYSIAVPAGTYNATLQLHYEDAELNGNTEASLGVWDYNGTTWINNNSSSSNTSTNFVSLAGVTNLAQPWTLSDVPNVTQWTGAVSTDWNTAGNWTAVQGSPGAVPTANDIVQIGTAAFTNQPTITTTANASSIQFGSAQAATLTLGPGGSLTTAGNINGSWSAGAAHTINVGAQTLTIGGSLTLSDGTAGHAINLGLGTGTITVGSNLTQSGGATISFTGNGTLNIGGDFLYTSGTFTAGTGTVTYNGTTSQLVAGLTYNNLTVNNSGGIASLNTAAIAQGSLTLSAGTLDLNAAATITGNVTIGSGTTLIGDGITASIGGNWTNNGTFTPGSGTVQFNGTGAQSISASTFNNLIINSSGTATLGGNITVNSDLTLSAGTLDIGTFTASRSTSGGTCTLASGAALLAGGASNFPASYSTYNLATGSTVTYNGTTAQSIAGITYGNLSFTNSGAKTLTGPTTAGGDLSIGSGATLSAGTNTLSLGGNWTNSGTFTPGTGTVLLNGSGKTITGNTTFNRLTISGSYTVAGSDLTFNGLVNITPTGSFAVGSGTATVNGDLTNSGTLTSTGTTTFTGTTLQTIRLLNAIQSVSTGVINFNGTVSPVLNSTSTPTYANLNINNTGGVNPSVNWTVLVSFTVASGATFNGGNLTHTFSGAFTNNGTVTSSGTLNFSPPVPVTINLGTGLSSTGTIIFGGSGVITLSGTPAALENVTISNTNAAGVNPPSGWTLNGDLDITSNSTFNAGSNSYSIAGDVESDGAINGGTSTFTLSSPAGLLSGSSVAIFNNLTITGNYTAVSDFGVAGNFVDNGTLDASLGQLTMTGSNAASISGSANPLAIAQVGINKTVGTVVTLSQNLGSVTSLELDKGIFDIGSLTVSQDAVNGGDLSAADSSVLRIGGTSTLPAFTTYELDTFSTVEYAGSTQSIATVTPYGGLTISAAGSKTPSAALSIAGNLTISNGTFVGGAFTHSVGGNWNMTGGSFTNTGTTIQLNGIGAQSISSTGAFNNLTINNATGPITLGSNTTVNNTLAFTAGKLSLLNSSLTIGSAGTITGASATSYIIARGTGTLTQQVTNGGSKSFPVGTNANYIPATVALTAGSVTDNISLRVIDTVYFDGTSGTTAQSNAVNATWMISEGVAGGSNATITLQWPGALELPGFIRSASRLAHYTSGSWDYGASDISATGTDPYTVTRSGFTSLSPFTVSSFGALPVTWLDVSGQHIGSDNYIYWSTASTLDNDHFNIEVSGNGTDFTDIGQIPGHGTTSTVQQYSFVDKDVLLPTAWYRIKQVDIDGSYSYSKTIVLTGTPATTGGFLSISNPTFGVLTGIIGSTRPWPALLVITDLTGRIIQTQSVTLNTGSNRISVDISSQPNGLYLIQYEDEKGIRQVRKFIKQ